MDSTLRRTRKRPPPGAYAESDASDSEDDHKRAKRVRAQTQRRKHPLAKLDPTLPGWRISTYYDAVRTIMAFPAASPSDGSSHPGRVLAAVTEARERGCTAAGIAAVLKPEMNAYLRDPSSRAALLEDLSPYETGLLGAAMLTTLTQDAVRQTLEARATRDEDFLVSEDAEALLQHIDCTEHFDWAAELLSVVETAEDARELAENFSDDFFAT